MALRDLTSEDHLRKCTVTLYDHELRAMVYKKGTEFYIFQDRRDGSGPGPGIPSKYGFKYAWSVNNGEVHKIKTNTITSIIFDDEEDEPKKPSGRKKSTTSDSDIDYLDSLSSSESKEKEPKIKLLTSNKFIKINQNE